MAPPFVSKNLKIQTCGLLEGQPPQPLQFAEHWAQCPEQVLLSGQPMHRTPFFFAL